MSYKILAKYSNEITAEEWGEIVSSFNLVFDRNFDLKYFKDKYTLNPLSFSCHGILYYKNSVVGFFSVVPREYIFNGKKELLGQGCDAYVLKEHRVDEFFLKKMADNVIAKFTEYNIFKFISLPNPKAYKYWKILGKWKDIGRLDYYVYPVNFIKLATKKNILPYVNYVFSHLVSSLLELIYISNKKQFNYSINLNINEQNRNERLHLESYKYLRLKSNAWGCYRVFKEDDLNVAYLIHLSDKSKKSISGALTSIISKEKTNIDLIVYIGNLKDKPIHLIKVHEKKHPRKMHFIGLSSNKKQKEYFFELNNWDVSLVDFDNR